MFNTNFCNHQPGWACQVPTPPPKSSTQSTDKYTTTSSTLELSLFSFFLQDSFKSRLTAPQGSCPSSAKEILSVFTSLQTQLFEAVSKLQEILHLQYENQKVTREIRSNDSAILAFANKLKGAERGLDNLLDDYSDYRRPKPARISYTTFAPPEFGGGQAPLRGALPPAPQDEQMRASQLYNFADLDVGLPETDEGKENILEPLIEPPAKSNPLANLSAIQGLLAPPGWKPGMPVELPTDLPLPPPGWKPGDPIALPPVDSLPLQKVEEAPARPVPPPGLPRMPEPIQVRHVKLDIDDDSSDCSSDEVSSDSED